MARTRATWSGDKGERQVESIVAGIGKRVERQGVETTKQRDPKNKMSGSGVNKSGISRKTAYE